MIHLDYRDARPIYSQIIAVLREQITAGVLKSGEKLPSVRELAAELSINPNTIQRAYRALEADGWIESAPGKGSFVRSRIRSDQLRLWQNLNDAVRELLADGVTREELIKHITGGADHA